VVRLFRNSLIRLPQFPVVCQALFSRTQLPLFSSAAALADSFVRIPALALIVNRFFASFSLFLILPIISAYMRLFQAF
ncbi:hypothetical protein, partial [Oscillibacter ruminantium]|uniref:hypothetical protein n=1 Tax=Oscillibacter ruminantium TaxID=1263547 RepID=UPI001A9A65DE